MSTRPSMANRSCALLHARTCGNVRVFLAERSTTERRLGRRPRLHAQLMNAYRGRVAAIGEGRRILLLLVLIVGVLGMHALMAGPHGADHCSAGNAASVTSTDPAPVDMPIRTGPVVSGVEMVDSWAADPECEHGSEPMPMDGHDLLHLCVAILVAGVVVLSGLAAIRLAWSSVARARTDSVSSRVEPHPCRPPPQHGTRLATLCVMRN